ncbi:MAG: SMC-Scp complex subunit ScpB [Planctomycetes bacterium]|nr:SMC-Scp complex subunit ScpB [Planctomycetota bacterium]
MTEPEEKDETEPKEEAPAEAAAEPAAEPAGGTHAKEPGGEGLDLSQSKLAEGLPTASEAPKDEEREDAEPATPVDLEALGRTIEALLFASEAPLTAREMARAAGARTADVRRALVALKEQIEEQRRPYEVAEVANGVRLVTRAEHHPAIQRLKAARTQRKLTQAGLETLALIAYNKDPIARAEIESVRGVDAGPVLRLLLDRKLIKIAGRGTGLGQPLLYCVSSEFLEHFGLKSAQDLPKPGEFKSA